MSDRKESEYWFKRRRYGYGWVPATWQGWLTLVVFLAAVGVAVVALVGPKPRWRWGSRGTDNPARTSKPSSILSYMRYVALLRGVNVGGNKRVSKAEFQAVLEGLGCREVTIYLNSGNAVFTSDSTVESAALQSALEGYFGFTVPTLVLAGEKVRAIARAIPSGWTNDAPRPDKLGQKSDVLYLFGAVNTVDILGRLGYRSDIEEMIYVDGAVLANISRANQSRGSLQKLIGSELYSHVTVRNVNTARKLAELV